MLIFNLYPRTPLDPSSRLTASLLTFPQLPSPSTLPACPSPLPHSSFFVTKLRTRESSRMPSSA